MDHLHWPFFDQTHRGLGAEVHAWAAGTAGDEGEGAGTDNGLGAGTDNGLGAGADVETATRAWVRKLGKAGWLKFVVPAAYGGEMAGIDVRSLCIIREVLAYRSGIADFTFAMQGLGTGPITLFGSDQQKHRYLPPVASGEKIAAFAISERDAGSDLRALQTAARRSGTGWVINGEKTWISNAGIADHYIVFCRLPELGEESYGAFIVDADTRGMAVSERIEVIAPQVLGTLLFENCRIDADSLIGQAGAGLKIALATLDVFRTTVGAAALGFSRRALHEAVAFTTGRSQFGKLLAEQQMTQARLADMAVATDAMALLVYRAAWEKDSGAARITGAAAMAKLFATESAQQVIDSAVQLHGGRGVVAGAVVERLYREVRALRIYEGTSEIQKLVIARQLLAAAKLDENA